MKPHLDLERSTYLVYGLLEADEKVQAAAHLSDCRSCADAVRCLEEERGLIVEATATSPPSEEMVRSVAAQVYARVAAIRRARSRRLWLLGCAAGAFAAIGLVFITRTRELAEARHAVAVGRVSVERHGSWVDQADGYKPAPGDRIRTDDLAGATIRLEEGSQFKIKRGSMVEFRGIRGPTAVLRLLEGEVSCTVVADPRPFTVEAAGATATVVGTEFVLHVLDDQPFFKPEERILRPPKVGLLVAAGAVVIRTSEGELRVPAGWIALAGTKGAPWIWGKLEDLAAHKGLEKMLHRTPIAKPAVAPLPIETGWKERTDAAVQARVDAVPWADLADALVRYHREIDDAVTEQRPLRVDPDPRINLDRGWALVRKLAEELGLNPNADFRQACRNKLASGTFIEAMAEALSGTSLDEEQLKRLQVPESIENLLPIFDLATPALESWKVRAEKTLAFVRQLKDVLPEDQYRRVTRNVGPSFLVERYRVWLVEAASAEEAADRMARIWGEEFQLPTYALARLAEIAVQHVRAHRETVAKHRSGQGLTGVEELELAARLFELQAKAERNVSEIPSLTGQARARAANGSKVLFRIKIAD